MQSHQFVVVPILSLLETEIRGYCQVWRHQEHLVKTLMLCLLKTDVF